MSFFLATGVAFYTWDERLPSQRKKKTADVNVSKGKREFLVAFSFFCRMKVWWRIHLVAFFGQRRERSFFKSPSPQPTHLPKELRFEEKSSTDGKRAVREAPVDFCAQTVRIMKRRKCAVSYFILFFFPKENPDYLFEQKVVLRKKVKK